MMPQSFKYEVKLFQLQNDDKDFYYVMDNFEIDMNYLLKQEKELTNLFS